MAKHEEKKYEDVMREAQYRKSRGIAYFNSINSAIEVVKEYKPGTMKRHQALIVKWRDWFLEEYTKDYAMNIANIGFDEEVMKGLDNAKKAYENKNGLNSGN